MVPVCNTSPHKFIFQRNLFYSKKLVFTPKSTNHSVAKAAKALIQLSEGRWFEPTYGFYLFFELFQFLKDYHSISAKKRNRLGTAIKNGYLYLKVSLDDHRTHGL